MAEEPQAHLALGLLLSTGLALGSLASRVGLPRIAAYVVAGICFSPPLLGGTLGLRLVDGAGALTSTALGVIAYVIGGAMTGAQLKRAGRIIVVATLCEALAAAAVVCATVLLLLPPTLYGVDRLHLALAFGAMACTTAPAATVAVLHQYRARGPMSDVLLGVVSLDDAVGLTLFAGVVAATTGGSLASGLAGALGVIAGSVALGTAGGWLLSRAVSQVHETPLRLPAVLAGILLCSGLAEALHLSPLLAAIVLGFSARWLGGPAGDRLFAPVEHLEEFVFLIFFTVAGAHFDAWVFAQHLPLLAAYSVARVAGKVGGATLGARLAGAPPQVVRWLGPALVPQAGVAVGLALALARQPAFSGTAGLFLNVILGSTLLYELLGPLAVRAALSRAGELGERRSGARADVEHTRVDR